MTQSFFPLLTLSLLLHSTVGPWTFVIGRFFYSLSQWFECWLELLTSKLTVQPAQVEAVAPLPFLTSGQDRAQMSALWYPHSRFPLEKLFELTATLIPLFPLLLAPYSSALTWAYAIHSLDSIFTVISPYIYSPLTHLISSTLLAGKTLTLGPLKLLLFHNCILTVKHFFKQLLNKTNCFYFNFVIRDLKCCIMFLLQIQYFPL